MSDKDTLSRLSKQHKEEMPEDLRDAKDFRWYLNEVVENPEIARKAHQRLADMFDHYGTDYNEDWEIIEYEMAS